MKKLQREAWVPIRETAGRRWMDLSGLAYSPELAQIEVEKTKARIPTWDEPNPCIRIAHVIVMEVEP